MQVLVKIKQAGHASPNRHTHRLTATPELADDKWNKTKGAWSHGKEQMEQRLELPSYAQRNITLPKCKKKAATPELIVD
jgi:hypothetical protein